MLNNQTIGLLRSLRLHGMADGFEQQLGAPETFDLPFEERLGLLVDREVASRDTRRLGRLLAAAKLRQAACLEDITYRPARGLDKRQVAGLADGAWIRGRHNLLITGATGTGKTYLACAFATAACRRGHSALYARTSRLLDEMRIARGNGSHGRRLQQLARVDVLLLDDFGLQKLGTGERQDLLEVLEDRCGARSTIVTSQLPIPEWHEAVGSPNPMLADAILDRLLTNAHRLVLKGESIRPTRTPPGGSRDEDA
jgi:DNA replication protein DnaC